MKKIIMLFGLSYAIMSQAAFIELNNGYEFNALIQESQVPVVVQFSAYWCSPCQSLKSTFKRIAPQYSDTEVRLAVVDAYVNTELQQYLKGGYPTVRAFQHGSLMSAYFVGDKSTSYVQNFIDSLIGASLDNTPDWEEQYYCPIE